MVTKNKGDWKYGRIDVRAKMPIGQGLWAAIWMLSTEELYGGWPRSGEIDIMEYLGHEPQRTFGTIHYGHDFWRFNSQGLELEAGMGTFVDDFHVFTVLWNENCIQFQMDGINVGVANTRTTTLPTTFPFDQNFHLLLNLAVGGNLPGNPDGNTVFPQTMEVDYVRVYQ
jgi:beta-glucanase (GH16 family)